MTVQLRPTCTITGRLVGATGKPMAGRSFQVHYDEGPGRPGVYFGGGFRHRLPTPAESTRKQRTDGTYGDKGDYVTGPEKSEEQGRFCISGLFPEATFDLKVMLTRASGDPKGKGEIIVGLVKVARPTLKPGEILDLGDLKVEERVK